jgi:hypothetical protein
MKEFDVALKAVADGLRTIAQGMEKLAEKLEESTPKKQAKPKPASKTAAKSEKATAKKAMKKTAADTVYTVIKRSKKGVTNATLAKKTGFDKKKIANIIFKLRKQGKIKSIDRGVYTKA